jgi:hypothetical protein
VPLVLASLAGGLVERSHRQELAAQLAVAALPHEFPFLSTNVPPISGLSGVSASYLSVCRGAFYCLFSEA